MWGMGYKESKQRIVIEHLTKNLETDSQSCLYVACYLLKFMNLLQSFPVPFFWVNKLSIM